MAQGILPYKYEKEKIGAGITSMAGIPVYFDLMQAIGIRGSIERHVRVRQGDQGWKDYQVLTSLIMLNLAGGDCVDDLEILENDEGFCKILRKIEYNRLPRTERRQMEKRWRKERKRTVPSQSAVFRYLEGYHDEKQERNREKGKAYIPEANEHLKGLVRVNTDIISRLQKIKPVKEATLDIDATLVETQKQDALYCYKKYKAYQPLNVWWAQQGVVLHTEFRDGNVPAGCQNARIIKEAMEMLPEGVEKVSIRSDTAGYQHEILEYLYNGKNKRFGKIEFAIGVDINAEVKKAVREVREKDWCPMKKGQQEWAEICFVPNRVCKKKYGSDYRYIAVRERLNQKELPGIEIQEQLPFPTIKINDTRYKITAIVTNKEKEGEELIGWYRERCGKSEEAHSKMKSDFAGGKLPSGAFGANAAWWWIMVLSMNLNEIMKAVVLGKSWISKRMKAIRYTLINLPGRIIAGQRQLKIRISETHPGLAMILEARRRIKELTQEPSG